MTEQKQFLQNELNKEEAQYIKSYMFHQRLRGRQKS